MPDDNAYRQIQRAYLTIGIADIDIIVAIFAEFIGIEIATLCQIFFSLLFSNLDLLRFSASSKFFRFEDSFTLEGIASSFCVSVHGEILALLDESTNARGFFSKKKKNRDCDMPLVAYQPHVSCISMSPNFSLSFSIIKTLLIMRYYKCL